MTRTDGSGAVTDGLERASRLVDRTDVGGQPAISQHEVPRLSTTEIDQLVMTFPQLSQWANEPRAAWLLGRPGLVDMLLRAGPAATMPDDAASEADLFAVVWRHLVRRGEITQPGAPSPDARDQALRALARRELMPNDRTERPDPAALPSLRSDGLLRPPGPTSAWSPSDQFASDLVRDMAVVRLLITDGFDLLAVADAPRWALRAARITCQAKLLNAPDVRRSFGQLRAEFADLASHHGQRWEEVPWEALLTLGTAREVLTQTWPDVVADDHAGLRTVLRLADQRYTRYEFGDPVILGPLVELGFCADSNIGADDDYSARNIVKSIRELILAWLRGLINGGAGPNPLRQKVRDRVLASNPSPRDEFAVEALAMLGSDLDERAQAFLMRLVADGGRHLEAAVERLGPRMMMAHFQPDLLLVLAESYYIERRDDDEDFRFGGGGFYPFDDGIRHHRFRGGIGDRMVAWYYGPFWQLLVSRPRLALALVNRMLDHAAAIRVGNHDIPETRALNELQGIDLDLPGVGIRHCVGDEHVWTWYRGSSVGPYPCMSALLAVERYADQLVDIAGVPLAHVAELLLQDCHNLAMPGLGRVLWIM